MSRASPRKLGALDDRNPPAGPAPLGEVVQAVIPRREEQARGAARAWRSSSSIVSTRGLLAHGLHDAGGAQDRQPALDAQVRVERPPRDRLPFWDREENLQPARAAAAPRTASACSAIMRRGTVLMAAAPTGWSSPGRVTRPTPGPPSMRMPGSRARQTVATMSRPSVASGSSPASLRTAQTARSPSMRQNAGATRHLPALGRREAERFRRGPGQQEGRRALRRQRRARPRGVAAAQLLCPLRT